MFSVPISRLFVFYFTLITILFAFHYKNISRVLSKIEEVQSQQQSSDAEGNINSVVMNDEDLEKLYEERRQRIQSYCGQQPNNFSSNYYSLLHVKEFDISMCPIAKVGSTTWLKYFRKLGFNILKYFYELFIF